VTLGDGDFTKFPMKMIYTKLSKTASLPVTCHRPEIVAILGRFYVSFVLCKHQFYYFNFLHL
jgi:hypothetical protein